MSVRTVQKFQKASVNTVALILKLAFICVIFMMGGLVVALVMAF